MFAPFIYNRPQTNFIFTELFPIHKVHFHEFADQHFDLISFSWLDRQAELELFVIN